MNSLISGAVAFAQRHALDAYSAEDGSDGVIWWPASAAAGPSYTVQVPCAAGTLSTGAKETAGLPMMPSDGRQFFASLADFPFRPLPDMTFIFGPPDSGTYDPAASRKYLITGCKEFGGQITITASDHGPA